MTSHCLRAWMLASAVAVTSCAPDRRIKRVADSCRWVQHCLPNHAGGGPSFLKGTPSARIADAFSRDHCGLRKGLHRPTRPAERVAADPRRRRCRLPRARRDLHGVADRVQRHHRGGESKKHLGRRHDGGRAEGAVDAFRRRARDGVEKRACGLARSRSAPVRPGTEVGHLRLLHCRDRRQAGRQSHRLHRQRR